MQVNGQLYYVFFVNDLFGHQSFVKEARQRELAGPVASLLTKREPVRASAADRLGDRASRAGFEVVPIAGRDGHPA